MRTSGLTRTQTWSTWHRRGGLGAVLWSLRQSEAGDASWMAELRAVVMQPDLARLGRYDPVRVRQRFLDGFAVPHTRVVVIDGQNAGLIAVRPEPDSLWIEHFYLFEQWQGQGIGQAVLAETMSDAADEIRPFRLNVLQGSPALRLYERNGFRVEREDPVDIYMVAEPGLPRRR